MTDMIQAVNVDEINIDDIEAALGAELETIETDDAGDLAEIEESIAAEEKQAAYDAQESTVEVESEEDVAAKKGKKGKKATPAVTETADEGETTEPAAETAAEPAKPKRMTFETPSAAIRHYMGADPIVLDATVPESDYADHETVVLAQIDGLAKKVKEKAVNVFVAVSKGDASKLSNYTQIAFDALKESGTIDSAGLKKAYEAKYSSGTAAAQAQQMFALFPALRIARREKNVLTLNENSVLVDALSAK